MRRLLAFAGGGRCENSPLLGVSTSVRDAGVAAPRVLRRATEIVLGPTYLRRGPIRFVNAGARPAGSAAASRGGRGARRGRREHGMSGNGRRGERTDSHGDDDVTPRARLPRATPSAAEPTLLRAAANTFTAATCERQAMALTRSCRRASPSARHLRVSRLDVR